MSYQPKGSVMYTRLYKLESCGQLCSQAPPPRENGLRVGHFEKTFMPFQWKGQGCIIMQLTPGSDFIPASYQLHSLDFLTTCCWINKEIIPAFLARELCFNLAWQNYYWVKFAPSFIHSSIHLINCFVLVRIVVVPANPRNTGNKARELSLDGLPVHDRKLSIISHL